MSKLVSVIIPTYKRPDYLARAIESVLNQTHTNLELIIVDDNDPSWIERELTEKLVKTYKDKDSRIMYLKHETNKNGSVARNTGFKYSSGEYIMFLDDDDEFKLNKVKAQVESMERSPQKIGANYTRFVRFKNGKLFDRSTEQRSGSYVLDVLMRNFFIQAGSNLLIRREAFVKLVGFDETFERNQDIEFILRLMLDYEIAYVDELGLVHHKTHKKLKLSFKEITEHFIDCFKDLMGSFDKDDQVLIHKMLNLQLIRDYFNRKDFKEALNLRKTNEISFRLMLLYMLHLVKRRLLRQIGPFDLIRYKR